MKQPSDFKTRKEFYQYLVSNKAELIAFKKAAIKFSDAVNVSKTDSLVIKALNTSHKDDIASGVIKRTIIGNTYNWMDSHDDVHADGCFSKSITERQDKIWHLHDHEQKITAKVGKPTSIYEKAIDWKDLGVNLTGKTQSLFMDSDIRKDYNELIFEQYLNGEIDQHSVGMRYNQIHLAINNPEMKPEFAMWSQMIGKIGNKERCEEQGFFWAVIDATLVEISCVLAGSNELTPTLENESKEIKDVVDAFVDKYFNVNTVKDVNEQFYDRVAKALAK